MSPAASPLWLVRVAAACSLLGLSGWAQEAELEEVRHPSTSRVLALVAPAAARNGGAALKGAAASGLHPSARNPRAQPQRPVAGWMPDATLRAAARRFGLGEPERELAFQRAESDGLGMVHEGWEQQWQGVPVYGAALIVHRNARGEVTSIGGRVLSQSSPRASARGMAAPDSARESDATPDGLKPSTTLPALAPVPKIGMEQAVAAARVAAEAAPEFVRARRMALAAARREVGDSPAGVAARMQAFAAEAGFQLSGTPRLYWYDEAFLADRSDPAAQSSPRASARESSLGALARPSVRPDGTPEPLTASDELKLGTTLRGAAAETLLVWKLTLRSGEEWEETYFVDAATGKIVKRRLDIDHATTRQIYDCGTHYGDGACYLNRITGIYGFEFYFGRSEGEPARGPSPVSAPIYGSTDVDYFYNLMQTNPAGSPIGLHTFLLSKFGRDGANSLGGTGDGINVARNVSRILANADLTAYGQAHCNATTGGFAWAQTTSIAVCRGSLANDLLAHEYSHVVARNMSINPNGTSNSLVNQNQSGSLNESNSDIMGESYEKYLTGTNNWIFWIEAGSGTGIRNLAHPEMKNYVIDSVLIPYPDRFQSPNFYCGTLDTGGIHVNSTVPSHAAYLASEGGSFNGCQIQGLGLAKVEQIWYRALTTYYVPSETFNGAYVALRQACLDLYPAADCAELTKALQAVELDQPGKCSGLPAQPPACAPRPVLHTEPTPLGPRWFWGSEAAGWTLQVNYDLANPAGWTDVQVITGPGEYLPQASAPAMFCRLNYKR